MCILSSTFDTVAGLDILGVAETWSYWDGDIPDSVPRTLELPDALTASVCVVVQGVRRCGKSTLLQQIVEHYGLNPAHCAFVNFEDPRLVNDLTFESLQLLVDRFRERHPKPTLTFFLDEIQAVVGWEKWLRSQLDRGRDNLFVITGSNASLLSGELSSVLTGRHLTVELYPFDFSEVKRVRRTSLERYLSEGGFPEPLFRKDGDSLRRQYFIDIVERDVRERVGARSSLPIRQVIQMAFESAGSELSLRRLAGATGLAVETVASYLDSAHDAYLLFAVPYFAFSERRRASRNKKYYPVDPGLRRVAVTRTGADRGKDLECATHLALRKRYREVYYWRGKGEIDFVVREGNEIRPFQVTWDAPTQRHHAAVQEFYETFPTAGEATFVTAETFAQL